MTQRQRNLLTGKFKCTICYRVLRGDEEDKIREVSAYAHKKCLGIEHEPIKKFGYTKNKT